MLMVGGETWWCSASTVNTDSMPPAPPSRWPVIDLVELTTSLLGMVAEGQLDGIGLVHIAQRRGGAVRVEVLHLVGIDAGVAQAAPWNARGRPRSGAVMW
jgi:hypothetical protein